MDAEIFESGKKKLRLEKDISKEYQLLFYELCHILYIMSTTCPACFIVEIGMLLRKFCSSVITLNKERPVGLFEINRKKGLITF